MTASPKIRSVFCFELGPMVAPTVDTQAAETEIQLARTGSFYRVDMGHFKVTRSTLERMVVNALERGIDLAINYHHYGGDPNKPASERKAAGWVKPSSLEVRSSKGGFGLFGRARWTKEAAASIQAEELRYISPEIVWAETRMAASPAGPAGEAIGAALVGAALTNDPFFNLQPIVFSWRGARLTAPKRCNMLTEAGKTKISDLLKAAGVAETALEGLLAQITLTVIEDYKAAEMPAAPMAEEPAVEVEMQAAEGTAQAALAAAREANTALSARVKVLEARDMAREQEAAEQLFARYQAEGRFRGYAVAGTDPDGSKKARQLLQKGAAFFREVFESIPPLVGTPAPKAGALPTVPKQTPSAQTSHYTQDQGAALHGRVMGELKAKGLKMDQHAAVAAKFSRE